MSRIDTFHIGGFIAAAPQQNKAERIDSSTGYTRWNVAGAQVEQRALTPAETAALAKADTDKLFMDNGATLKSRAATALATNATYSALASPTVAQNTAQTKALTRQVNALIRLALNQLDSIADS